MRVIQRAGRIALLIVQALLAGGLAQSATSLVEPADRAANVPINVTLQWKPDPDKGYDVYFGENNPPAFQCRVTVPRFVLETLSAAKTYYWRVDAITDSGVKTGKVLRFKTAAKADRDSMYAWPIRSADTVRSLYPQATQLGIWNYTDGIIIDALYSIASRTGREDDFNYIRQYLDRFVSSDGRMDPQAYPFELFSLDCIRPASTLL
jgi:hypothetical protein